MKMDLKNNKKYQVITLAVLFVAAVAIFIYGFVAAKRPGDNETATSGDTKDSSLIVEKIVEKEVEKFVEVEREITTEIITEGLNDMGVLITQEYFYTQVETYTSTKTLFKIIPLESEFAYSYDGVVAAGIDCSQIRVEKDAINKIIFLTLPHAEIKYNDIDTESFQLINEKEGFGNKLTLTDYSTSLDEFKKSAEKRAVEKGIIDKADANAELMIRNFVNSLLSSEYTITFIYK